MIFLSLMETEILQQSPVHNLIWLINECLNKIRCINNEAQKFPCAISRVSGMWKQIERQNVLKTMTREKIARAAARPKKFISIDID